jgi:hypothetical protein
MVCVGVIGLLLAVGAATGWGWRAGLSVAVGSALAVANLWSLKRIGTEFFSDRPRKRRI